VKLVTETLNGLVASAASMIDEAQPESNEFRLRDVLNLKRI